MSNELQKVSEFAQRELGIGATTTTGMLRYGQALLVIAGADGEVSPKELGWLVQHHRRFGAPEEVIQQYASFDFKSANLETLLTEIVTDVPDAPASVRLIYHAIHMCSADGEYAEAEKGKVVAAAASMKVPPTTVAALHALVELESSVTKMRKALFGTDQK